MQGAASAQGPAGARRIAPVIVTAITGARQVVAELDGLAIAVTLAIAGPYEPRIDDELLAAIDDDGRAWAIGVIRGLRAAPAGPRLEVDPATGATILRADGGDLELRADAGSVRIAARDRVDLRAALVDAIVGRVALRADAIETRAARLVERLGAAYREVEGLSQLHAGRLRTVVDQTIHTLGRRILSRAIGDHKIEGEKIHIG